MRLTDEERRIADDVAWYYVIDGAAFDAAWECAIAYIAARRKALGEVEAPDDATVEVVNNGKVLLPKEIVAAYRDMTRAAWALYQHRWTCDTLTPAQQAEAWEQLRDALGLPPGTATAAGVGAHEVEVRVGQGDDGTGVPLTARIVRPAAAAGVAAPTAEAVGEDVVAWYADGDSVREPHRAWDRRGDAETVARAYGGTVVPLVRQGSQGVRVTVLQREALRIATGLVRALDQHEVARPLEELLASIDAAKGVAT